MSLGSRLQYLASSIQIPRSEYWASYLNRIYNIIHYLFVFVFLFFIVVILFICIAFIIIYILNSVPSLIQAILNTINARWRWVCKGTVARVDTDVYINPYTGEACTKLAHACKYRWMQSAWRNYESMFL